jgi:hypothetical protein
VPETTLLDWYLGDRYEGVLEDFLAHEGIVVPDKLVGWVNKPNYVAGNWIADDRGARVASTSVPHQTKPINVAFFGSSTINGGNGVGGGQTISAYLDSEDIAASNFGSMLYSIDQSLLAYLENGANAGYDFVVVGIDDEVETASSLFVPLQSREEVNLPFLRPAFKEADGRLQPLIFGDGGQPTREDWPALLDYLAEHDTSYYMFETYKRWGLLPLASLGRTAYIRLRKAIWVGESYDAAIRLQLLIMGELVRDAAQYDAEVLFVKFSPLAGLTRSSYFVDRHKQDRYRRSLESSGMNVLFLDSVLAETGRPFGDFFRPDGVHLAAEANQIVADKLRAKILKMVDARQRNVSRE